jgi:hypothetical protein
LLLRRWSTIPIVSVRLLAEYLAHELGELEPRDHHS